MTDTERSDLAAMKVQVAAVKASTVDYMLFINRNGIANSGHRTLEDALLWTIQDCQRRLDRITQAYLKRYPDK